MIWLNLGALETIKCNFRVHYSNWWCFYVASKFAHKHNFQGAMLAQTELQTENARQLQASDSSSINLPETKLNFTFRAYGAHIFQNTSFWNGILLNMLQIIYCQFKTLEQDIIWDLLLLILPRAWFGLFVRYHCSS